MTSFVLKVRVAPGARRTSVGGAWMDGAGTRRLVVRVAAPPEDGKANAAVCAATAVAFGLPKGAVAVTAGAKSRLKTLSLESSDAAALKARLDALMEEQS